MDKQCRSPFLRSMHLYEGEEYYIDDFETNRPRFNIIPANVDLDINTKRVALKVCSAVVSLESFSDEEVLYQSSGTVFEVDGNNNFVLTSASLVRRRTKEEVSENTVANNLKVVVHTKDGTSSVGEIYVCDFHYNLLVIVFKSNSSIEAAKLRLVDFHENVFEEKPFLRRHSVNVKPRDSVIVAGRYFYKPFVYMAAPGSFSIERHPSFECKELLATTCQITRCGDGGPLINQSGEVIGIAFYEVLNSPFLPINIPYQWWDHYKRYKELRHPSIGFVASDLEHSVGVDTLEEVMRKFPSISGGVVVEKVLSGSYAQKAGLSKGDIIIKCDGKTTNSFLELWKLVFDKVGESVELEVARVDLCSVLSLTMVVAKATTEELYKFEEDKVGCKLLFRPFAKPKQLMLC